MEAPSPLLDRVRALLEDAGAPYRHLRHPEARTTEALAAARGMPVSAGVKALVFTIKGRYTVLALRADRETDNRRVRRALGAQKLRFARLEELAARLVADAGVLEGDVVAFTAGSATDSLVMAAADWARVARPEVLDFAR